MDTIEKGKRMDTSENMSQSPEFAVVLLHGLMAEGNELELIATKIHYAFEHAALVIQPMCRAGMKSVRRSTNTQAKDIFKHIQSEFARCNKKVESFPLIIIGYSHGGVLACTIGSIYKSQLNICGIVTINAPLMGVPVLERSHTDVQEFMTKAQEGLQLIGLPHSLSRIKWSMWLHALGVTLMRPHWMPIPFVNGLKDIIPNSVCMKDVHHFLRGESHNIPCLLISSFQNDFRELFNKKMPEHNGIMTELNDIYAQFVTGNKVGQHDTLIPLPSQLCRSNSFNDLSAVADVDDPVIMPMPNRPNVEGHIYKGMSHASNLIIIDVDLLVCNGQTVFCSDRILTDLVQFIRKLI